ncbi:MAG: hypothetical protein LBJ78_04230 [Puniceicoccales bacterium]|jgi:hypothetical protein|nr:hypothetical protein [Puniceicoccales bacterium]
MPLPKDLPKVKGQTLNVLVSLRTFVLSVVAGCEFLPFAQVGCFQGSKPVLQRQMD